MRLYGAKGLVTSARRKRGVRGKEATEIEVRGSIEAYSCVTLRLLLVFWDQSYSPIYGFGSSMDLLGRDQERGYICSTLAFSLLMRFLYDDLIMMLLN